MKKISTCISIFSVIMIPSFLLAQTSGTENTTDQTRSSFASSQVYIEEYPEDGKKYFEEQFRSLAAGSTIDWIKFTYLKCQANWNQTCEHTEVIQVPQGWQACRALYQVSASGRGTNYSVSPSDWYTNDPESPDRFRSYRLYMYAKGSGIIFDRWGANVDFTNVGIRLISAQSTNADRYRAGCEMPRHD